MENIIQPYGRDAGQPRRSLRLTFEKGVIGKDLEKRLRDLGINLPLLLKCLEKECRSGIEEFEARRP